MTHYSEEKTSRKIDLSLFFLLTSLKKKIPADVPEYIPYSLIGQNSLIFKVAAKSGQALVAERQNQDLLLLAQEQPGWAEQTQTRHSKHTGKSFQVDVWFKYFS